MPMQLNKTVRLEGGTLLSPNNKKWQKQFKALPKDQQKSIISSGAVVVTEDDDDDEDSGKPTDLKNVTVADLADALQNETDVESIKKAARRDKRATAAPVYEARIKELEDEATQAETDLKAKSDAPQS